MKTFICISLVNLLILTNAEEKGPLISLKNGLVRGVYKTSYDGRKYSSFEGIPYAKPPTGILRFQDPQPALGWLGILKATTTHKCVQHEIDFSNTVVGHEDCLYINVYVPRKEINANESLDVVVHLHGGGFMIGFPELAGPSKLMDRDIVYINLSYRLGPLGFLSLGDNTIPGNYGMKDQSFALRWVKENIEKFGGNPSSVTITGVSAGGASAHLHYFSPISRGLFHRGIASSGIGLNPWAIKRDTYTRSKLLVQELGCFNESTEIILRCMQERPALQIQQNIRKQFVNYETALPLVLFGPTIEPASATAFLSTDPYVQYKEKTVTDVPLLSIMTTEEGSVPSFFYLQKLDLLNEKLRSYLPTMIEYDSYDEDIQKVVTDKVLEHYFNNEPITLENFHKFIKLGSDRMFHIGAEKSVRLHASSLKSNAYLLMMGYAGEAHKFGVEHGQDSKFYYDIGMEYYPRLNYKEMKMREKLLDMFANFVKTGIPTIEGVHFEPVPKDGTLKYLTINGLNDFKITINTSLGDTEFWDSLGL